MDEKLLELLEKQTTMLSILAEDKTKAAAAVNEAPLLFGDGGLWITPGLERDIITAYVRPQGLSSVIPVLPSVTENPIFGSITGIQGDGASPATNPCDDNPTGYVKGCNLTAQFGRLAFDTNTIEFDKVMLEVNRGVSTDLTLRGRLLGINTINPSGLSDNDVLDIVTASEMVKVGMLMHRGTTEQMGLVRQLWQGAIANNTAGGGYKEMPGLDSQIATGQVDATTNTACPAMDSDVKDFNYNNVDGSGALDIVEYMSMIEFYERQGASDMGLDPVEWVWVMRKDLWQELTAIWPIAYNTNRGASVLSGNNRLVVDGGDMIAQRDLMRRNLTIDVNGNTYRVVLDDGISEATNTTDANVPSGQFASSIYFVPLTITGGFPVTYIEHVDYRRGARDVARLMGKNDFWTDRGVFSWAIENQKWCYKLSLKTEWRVVLRTPHLAGRIDNVLYAPLQHLREGFEDSAYNLDGGVSLRRATATFSVWK
jgi:hypothetical protein